MFGPTVQVDVFVENLPPGVAERLLEENRGLGIQFIAHDCGPANPDADWKILATASFRRARRILIGAPLRVLLPPGGAPMRGSLRALLKRAEHGPKVGGWQLAGPGALPMMNPVTLRMMRLVGPGIAVRLAGRPRLHSRHPTRASHVARMSAQMSAGGWSLEAAPDVRWEGRLPSRHRALPPGISLGLGLARHAADLVVRGIEPVRKALQERRPRLGRPWTALVRQGIDGGAVPSGGPVCFIMRTYAGREALLAQACASIANQSYRPVQIAICDDGGGAQVKEALAPLQLESAGVDVVVLRLPKRGRSHAGNAGIQAAASADAPYACFLDDDDLLFPEHAALLVAALQREPSAAAAFAYSLELPTRIHHHPFRLEEGTPYAQFASAFSRIVLLERNHAPIQALLWRTNVLVASQGFNTALDYLEDWDLWLRCAPAGPVVTVPATTSAYRVPFDAEERQRRAALHATSFDIVHRQALATTFALSPHDVPGLRARLARERTWIARIHRRWVARRS